MRFAAILCLVLAVTVAYAADEVDVAHYHGRRATTAFDIISNEPNLSTLADLIRANNLTEALDDPWRPVTVFAPTNEALAGLVATLPNGTALNGPLLLNILLQHVTRAKVSPFMPIGSSVPSLNVGNDITRVSSGPDRSHFGKTRITSWRGGQNITVNSTERIEAKKAVVIVINGVLLPNNAFVSLQAATLFYGYTAFLSAVVNASGLDQANAPGLQSTYFAPSNAAFAAAAPIISQLPPLAVKAALAYGVSPGVFTVPFRNITIPTFLPSVGGFQTLNLVTPNIVVGFSGNATVVIPNIFFSGGVLQFTDRVLFPNLNPAPTPVQG